MKSAWAVTGAMALLAAALAIGAAVVYPWPEDIATTTQVNQKLFADLDVSQGRSISIVSFDRENRRFESIQLRRVRDSWFIPSAGDYPAGNATRIAAIFDSLSESVILEVKSSDESTHSLYGVIDSDLVGDASNQTGIGAKLSLADTNNRPLAQLIIGEKVGDNPNQRFVRIAGQPNVYVIELNESLLSTRLADWVDHNLLDLRLSEAGSGLDVAKIQIDHYVLEGEAVTPESAKKFNYRASVALSDTAQPLTLWKPDSSGQLGEAVTDRKLRDAGLRGLVSNLAQIQFSAVGRQPASATQAQLAGISSSTDLGSLANYGYRSSADSPSGIDGKNGQLVVSTAEGVDWTLSFGSVVGNVDATQALVSYYLLITAAANEQAFPMPPEPADPNDPDQKTDYERALKRRDDALAAARERAKQYTERHASWLYLISEQALLALRPDEARLIQ